MWGDSLGGISHIKLSQGAFRGNPPVSLVPPVFLLVGFPEQCRPTHLIRPNANAGPPGTGLWTGPRSNGSSGRIRGILGSG